MNTKGFAHLICPMLLRCRLFILSLGFVFFAQASWARPLEVSHIQNKIEAYIGHPLIQKCIGNNDLPSPDETRPKIDVNEDKENLTRIFSIQFKGSYLNPTLRVKSQKISLEKTSENSGYFLTISKPFNEKDFKLLFNLHNKDNESFLHQLHITDSGATLTMLLTEEQRERLCVRDQIWLGFGIPSMKTSQHNTELNADLGSTTAPEISSISLEYRKTLNSKISVHLSYTNAEPKINASQVAPQSDKQKWQSFETSLIWRNINFSRETKNLLFYPHLRLGYQYQTLPIYHLSNAGVAQSVNLFQQSIVSGLGVSVFRKNGFLLESGINLKWPMANNQMFFDGYIGVSKLLKNNFSLGLNLNAAQQRLNYETSEAGFKNTGTMDYLSTTLDFRLGWVF